MRPRRAAKRRLGGRVRRAERAGRRVRKGGVRMSWTTTGRMGRKIRKTRRTAMTLRRERRARRGRREERGSRRGGRGRQVKVMRWVRMRIFQRNRRLLLKPAERRWSSPRRIRRMRCQSTR